MCDWTLAVEAIIGAVGRLMHVAAVVTPNRPELENLVGEAAILRHGCHLVAKGGHAEGWEIVDRLLSPGGRFRELRGKRFDTSETLWTGCTLASALACGPGAGLPIDKALEQARRLVALAILYGPGLGSGGGPCGELVAPGSWGDPRLG